MVPTERQSLDVAPGRLAGIYLMRALQRSIGNTAVQRALTGASSGPLMVQRLRLVRDPRKGAPGREWRKLRDDEQGYHFDTLQMQPHQIKSLLFDLLQDNNVVVFKAVLTEAATNMPLEQVTVRSAGVLTSAIRMAHAPWSRLSTARYSQPFQVRM